MPRPAAWIVFAALVGAPGYAAAQTSAGINTTPPATWRLQLSADGSWYENPYFQAADQSATSWSTSGWATLTRTRRFRTGSFSLSGYGGMLYYPELDDFTQPTYGGSLSIDWASSRRTHFTLSQSYSHSNTRNLRSLDTEGLPLPTSSVDNFDTSLGLTHQLSERWQFDLRGSFVWRQYDNSELTDGKQVTGSFDLGRQLSKSTSMYLGYGYTASWFDQGVTRVHQALLGIRNRVDKGVSVELAGGVGYLESTESFYPAGNASLDAKGRRTSFTLSYHRDFGQAFGYGRQMISDVASANFSWTPHRKLTLNADYNFGYRRDAHNETYTVLSHIATGGFSWDIVRNTLSFGANYGWEYNETEGFAVVKGQRATASLSYGVDWR